MDIFFQAVAAALLTLIVFLTLDGHAKTTAAMLVMVVCVMILAGSVHFLRPVLAFLRTLSELTRLEEETLVILFKVLGISVISEIALLICSDTGCGALGKALQILANGAILWLSLPLFQALLDLVQSMLEAV